MHVEIDKESGFCFGVTNAVKKAEESLKKGKVLYCLGDIVHNSMEVLRLVKLGLKIIDHKKYHSLNNCNVLIRAHGEPPSTYEYAQNNSIDLIDTTCPVVLALQKKIRETYLKITPLGGQIFIYGKKGHAEVVGLNGQTNNTAFIIEDEKDLDNINIDINKPVVLFSQTTKSLSLFNNLSKKLTEITNGKAKINDTICRQVSNRAEEMMIFSKEHDIIIFVGGTKSSNAKYLYSICKRNNPSSFFVSEISDLNKEWFDGHKKAGICGATSTPGWLMEEMAEEIKRF